ncbi:MAG: hypothetical protein JWP96_2320 [Polaromonas sp.]|jgi:hypothetical protein|nr:hypothetical protein [Polaromonas sp.]
MRLEESEDLLKSERQWDAVKRNFIPNSKVLFSNLAFLACFAGAAVLALGAVGIVFWLAGAAIGNAALIAVVCIFFFVTWYALK